MWNEATAEEWRLKSQLIAAQITVVNATVATEVEVALIKAEQVSQP